MRCVMTRVLPEPAPARTSSGPSWCSTARACAGLRGTDMSSSSLEHENDGATRLSFKRVYASRMRTLAFITIPLALLAACGGENSENQPAVTPTSVASTPPPPPAAPPADVSQVPAPQGLFAVASATKPLESLKTIRAWTHIPIPAMEQLADALTSQHVGAAVDLAQPVDFAAALRTGGGSPQPGWAVSIAVKSLDLAKEAFGGAAKLTPASNGALRVVRATPSPDDDDERHCELGPAYGASGTRLVCGDSDASLDALSSYLRRTVTRNVAPSDLHFEVMTGAVRPLLESQKRGASAALSAMLQDWTSSGGAGRNLVRALATDTVEFGLDLDSWSLDFKLGDAAADLTMGMSFKSTNSLIARLATAHPERTDVPPSSVWQLPADATTVFFQRGIDASNFDGPRDLVLDAVSNALGSANAPQKERDALVAALKSLVSGTALVYGSGVDGKKFGDALKIQEQAPDRDARKNAERQLIIEALGWRVIGIDEPAAKLERAAKDFVAAYGNMVKKMGGDAAKEAPTLRVAAAPAGLPAGSADFELSISMDDHVRPAVGRTGPAPAVTRRKPLVFHALFVPDGGKTWVTIGGDLTVVTAKAQAVLSSAPDSGKLASRTDLDDFKNMKLGSGGYYKVGSGMLGLALWGATQRTSRHGSGPGIEPFLNAVAGIPVLSFGASAIAPSSGGTPSFQGVVHVPRAAVEQIVTAMIRILG